MNIVDAAMLIAIEAHGDTLNKHSGEIYTLHPAEVFIEVKNDGGDEICQAIAWLHDVLEDCENWTPATIQIYLANHIGSDYVRNTDAVSKVVQGVQVLTKIKGQSNTDHYNYVKQFERAKFVKMRDLRCNFRKNHKVEDPATRLRMSKKYSEGMDILR